MTYAAPSLTPAQPASAEPASQGAQEPTAPVAAASSQQTTAAAPAASQAQPVSSQAATSKQPAKAEVSITDQVAQARSANAVAAKDTSDKETVVRADVSELMAAYARQFGSAPQHNLKQLLG